MTEAVLQLVMFAKPVSNGVNVPDPIQKAAVRIPPAKPALLVNHFLAVDWVVRKCVILTPNPTIPPNVRYNCHK